MAGSSTSARPFLVVDFSDETEAPEERKREPDFQMTALEPGLPFLDASSVNWQVLRKWIGIHAAEPEWMGRKVGFYVRSEQGGRPENPNCQAVTESELDGPFRKSLQRMAQRLEEATPAGSSEELIHRFALQELKSLTSDPARKRERCNYFFKYRDESGKWQIVWCPGYKQKNPKPGTPVICTNPECSLLFLRRRDESQKCPACQSERKKEKGPPIPWIKIAAALLLLAVVGGAWFFWPREAGPNGEAEVPPPPPPPPASEPKLVVTPAEWSGPVGSRIEFAVQREAPDGQAEDIERDVVVEVLDPKVAEIKQYGLIATARAPGETVVRFNKGSLTTQATLIVEPPLAPSKIEIQPGKLELQVGATQRLKLVGTYDGKDEPVDLTDVAEWSATPGNLLFVYQGLVEALPISDPNAASVKGEVVARYRPNPESAYLTAVLPVEVRQDELATLRIALDPSEIEVGQAAELTAVATGPGENGAEHDLAESSKLTLTLEPEGIASLEGRSVSGLAPGTVTLQGTFEGLEATAELTVNAPSASEEPELRVTPTSLALAVGEVAELQIASAGIGGVSLQSLDPTIVAVAGARQLVGESPGRTQVAVSRGTQTVNVDVTVAAAELQSLALTPNPVTVAVDKAVTLRALGVLAGDGQQIDIAPNELDWVQLPDAAHVQLDMQSLAVRGVQPTSGAGESLTVRHQGKTASVRIKVIGAPLQLTLSPTGESELPLGQGLPLLVRASYGGASTIDVPPEKVRWILEPPDSAGFELRGGVLHAVGEAGQALTLKASYQQQESESLTVTSVTPLNLELALQLDRDPPVVEVGATGRAAARGTDAASGAPAELSPDFLRFTSSDPAVLAVDAQSGAYRALSAGKATLGATFDVPVGGEPAQAELEVTVEPAPEPQRPVSVAITTEQSLPVELPLHAAFDDFRVTARYEDGGEQDVTGDATLVVSGEVGTAALMVENGVLRAVRAGAASVRANFAGLLSDDALEIQVVEDLALDEIRVEPETVKLGVGESTPLTAVGYSNGRKVGDVGSHPQLEWRVLGADDGTRSETVAVGGSKVTGLQPGQADVAARYENLTSNLVSVVVGTAPSDPLRVEPPRVTLETGQTLRLASDLKVMRGESDVSDQCQITPGAAGIVDYDRNLHALVGGTPGQTQITFTLGSQSATADVEVLPGEPPSGDETVVLEPQGAGLVVGELVQPRVFLVTASGRRIDKTYNAILESDDTQVIEAEVGGLLALKPGTATVAATLPGVDEPARAKFVVEPSEFTRLEVAPAALQMAVGDSREFEVIGVDPNGRHTLGDHPDLDVALVPAEATCVELVGPRHLQAATGGEAQVEIGWRELEPVQIDIEVLGDELGELVFEPATIQIEEGEETDLSVLGRRGDVLQALTADDGIELRIEDPVKAEVVDGLRVRGLSQGETSVVARLGQLSAAARLTIEPRSTPEPPRGEPRGLRFIPDILRLELGTPGDSIRVVRLYAGGEEEDVDHLAEISFLGPEDVVKLEDSASGPVVRPLKVGQTSISASLEGMETKRPLMIEVAESLPKRARVVVRPNPLVLNVGETGRFGRVVVIPRNGGQPIELPYKLTATEPNAVELLPGNGIRALKPGRDLVSVVIQQPPDGKYHEIETPATVEVKDDALEQQADQVELVLSGPTELTVGEEAQFEVELVSGAARRSVTNDGAELVLTRGLDGGAAVGPACRIVAQQPGRIALQARHEGHVSSLHEVEIKPVADAFDRLEVKLAKGPLAVGESRPYEVFGYPRGSSPRQNVTQQFADAMANPDGPHMIFRVLQPGPEAPVADHEPPQLTGRQPGLATLQAALGDRVRSDAVHVRVAQAPQEDEVAELRIEPAEVRVAPGEETTSFQALARMRGEDGFRPVNVAFEVSEPSIVEPVEEGKGRFRAVAAGEAEIVAEYKGQQAGARIRVEPDAFADATPVKKLKLDQVINKRNFTLDITVTGGTAEQKLEYRCRLPDRKSVTGWVESTPQENAQAATLKTPPIPFGPPDKMYELIIESRPAGSSGEAVDRYPFSFILGGEITVDAAGDTTE